MITAESRAVAEQRARALVDSVGAEHAADLTDPKWVVYALAGAWHRLDDTALDAMIRNLSR
ncbi:hypothetical protein HWD35_20995 [Tsukamurella tyrosinosolvens]|uniref:hypothetical protein n=1 Tax=Tsukamurella tyrosinosolvens TaxID=57704 RepID=UPI001CE10672|nr:hypothetical protein [Tsukamurella tyrosinosolvens]MCA4997204.1 hypothetical protein [Tsukamurella tyrosinosolvens]